MDVAELLSGNGAPWDFPRSDLLLLLLLWLWLRLWIWIRVWIWLASVSRFWLLSFAFVWLVAFDLNRAVERAEHRSLAWPKSSPCLSAASLGCGTVKVPMCRVRRGAEGTDAASSHRLASGEGGFAYCCQDKSKPRDSAEALSLIFAPAVDSLPGTSESQSDELRSASKYRAFARCACESLLDGPKRNQKVPSPDAIRRDTAAAVPCASRSAGPAAQTRCAQTWAALRPRRPAMLGSLYGSIQVKG